MFSLFLKIQPVVTDDSPSFQCGHAQQDVQLCLFYQEINFSSKDGVLTIFLKFSMPSLRCLEFQNRYGLAMRQNLPFMDGH